MTSFHQTLGSDFVLQIDHQKDLVLDGFSSHLLFFSEEIKPRAQIITQQHKVFIFILFSVPMNCGCLYNFHVNKPYSQATDLPDVTGLQKEQNVIWKLGLLKNSYLYLLPWVLCKQGLKSKCPEVGPHLVSSSVRGVPPVSKGKCGNPETLRHG